MKFKTGKKSVETAAKYFESCGFTVLGKQRNISANGVDLHIVRDGRVFSVEVKTVSKSTRSYRVKGCHKPDSNDYIAMVYGSNVIVQPMDDHIRLCSKDGTRAVSKLIEMIKTDASDLKGYSPKTARN